MKKGNFVSFHPPKIEFAPQAFDIFRFSENYILSFPSKIAELVKIIIKICSPII